MRPSWIEVDLDAVEHNVQQLLATISPAELCAVVKADGYGHGDVPVAEAAIRGGATWLAVALVEEGIRLREADINVPILVLSQPSLSDANDVVGYQLTPTIYSVEFAYAVAGAAQQASTTPYAVHLKLDTGMHRVGAAPVEAFTVARAVEHDERLTLQGVFTHFSVADSDPDYTTRQNRALENFVEVLGSENIRPEIVHAANTAGAIDMPKTRHGLCRVGLGIYGLHPNANTHDRLDLVPAMRVVSEVVHTQDLPVDARPSYGRTRSLSAAGRVVTVPIGYADGVSRQLTETGSVLINSKRYSLAGTITMDMLVVDVGTDDVKVGDEVVLLGVQGADAITADEWAELLGTISYEVVCGFGPRLPRRYVRRSNGDQ